MISCQFEQLMLKLVVPGGLRWGHVMLLTVQGSEILDADLQGWNYWSEVWSSLWRATEPQEAYISPGNPTLSFKNEGNLFDNLYSY